MKKIVLLFLVSFSSFTLFSQEVTTVAGSTIGYLEGNSLSAKFNFPTSVCKDHLGNVYVADNGNHRIRKISSDGMVTTLAGGIQGFANGNGAQAKFNSPFGVCVDTNGNVYVADKGNNKIRKITPDGIVTTFAGSTLGFGDGTGTQARFNTPFGICIDTNGTLYVADYGNQKVRKITQSGVVTTLAGSTQGFSDGLGNQAKFNYLRGICVDLNNNVYVADYNNHKIRKITQNGLVTTIAGSVEGYVNGLGSQAQFSYPSGITVDSNGSLYVVEEYNHTVRKIKSSGDVITYAGTEPGFLDGSVSVAKFFQPCGIFIDSNNVIYVSDQSNQRIRKIASSTLDNQENLVVQFTISPNPTSDVLLIRLDENLELITIKIYSNLGQLIKSGESTTISTSDLSSGNYFIEITTDKGKATQSFIKQ